MAESRQSRAQVRIGGRHCTPVVQNALQHPESIGHRPPAIAARSQRKRHVAREPGQRRPTLERGRLRLCPPLPQGGASQSQCGTMGSGMSLPNFGPAGSDFDCLREYSMTTTTSANGIHTLWCTPHSLYSGKIRSYLIKKGVPFRELFPPNPRFGSEVRPAVRLKVAPSRRDARRSHPAGHDRHDRALRGGVPAPADDSRKHRCSAPSPGCSAPSVPRDCCRRRCRIAGPTAPSRSTSCAPNSVGSCIQRPGPRGAAGLGPQGHGLLQQLPADPRRHAGYAGDDRGDLWRTARRAGHSLPALALPARRAPEHRRRRPHGAAVRASGARPGAVDADEEPRAERLSLDRADEPHRHRRRRVSRLPGNLSRRRRDPVDARTGAAADVPRLGSGNAGQRRLLQRLGGRQSDAASTDTLVSLSDQRIVHPTLGPIEYRLRDCTVRRASSPHALVAFRQGGGHCARTGRRRRRRASPRWCSATVAKR